MGLDPKKTDERTYLIHRYQTIKQAFLEHPNILAATAYRMPMGTWGGISRKVKTESGETFEMLFQDADETFLNTFGIDLIAGRNISDTRPEKDGRQYDLLMNEAAVKQLGWSQPLGKRLPFGRTGNGTVIGIMKDFHSQSLHQEIRPLIITNKRALFRYMAVKIQSENISETIAFLGETWKEFLPDRPFDFVFVDESLNQLYNEDQKVGQLVGRCCAYVS